MSTLLNNTSLTPTVLASTTSSSMDDALVMASTAKNNTEDALVDSSPPGAQADEDDVQIVGLPPAIEERPHKKCKSNEGGDDHRGKQKKQQKRPATSKNCQKRPAISDANLEKQVNWVRDSSLQNVVDSSLQATQAPDSYGDKEVIKELTKYFTMPVTCTKQSLWWERCELFVPVKHPKLYKE